MIVQAEIGSQGNNRSSCQSLASTKWSAEPWQVSGEIGKTSRYVGIDDCYC
jgi:hypothetical protein